MSVCKTKDAYNLLQSTHHLFIGQGLGLWVILLFALLCVHNNSLLGTKFLKIMFTRGWPGEEDGLVEWPPDQRTRALPGASW